MGLHSVVQGLRSLFRKRAIEREMDEELGAFVEASTAEKMSRGMTLQEAARAARVEMGSAHAVKHHIRSAAWESKLEIFLRGIWYGVRSLARSPGFTAVAILTFALGVGLPIVFCVTHLIASKLFGVEPYDPKSLGLAALALCAVSVAAAYIPARRAASVDPMIALRDE